MAQKLYCNYDFGSNIHGFITKVSRNFEFVLLLFVSSLCLQLIFIMSQIFFPISFLYGSLLFILYTQLKGQDLNFTWKVLNVVPFLIAFMFYLYVLVFGKSHNVYIQFYYISSIVINLVYPFYIILYGLRLLKKSKYTIVILLELISLIFIGMSFFLFLDYMDRLKVINLDFNPIIVISVLIIISLVILGWFLIHKEKIIPISSGFKKIEINEVEMEIFKKEIGIVMERNQLYLDTNLNIFKLSQHLNVSEQLLRQYIYDYLKTNFNEWLAEYRIKHAIRLMKESENNWKLEFIATLSGFKSRTTFNRYFKELFGISASDFRNKLS